MVFAGQSSVERECEASGRGTGERRHIHVIQDTKNLVTKAFCIVSYHNLMHYQARRAVVSGFHFSALVAACALGERILNHLILDLRDHHITLPHYRRVYRNESFGDWRFAVRVLENYRKSAVSIYVPKARSEP